MSRIGRLLAAMALSASPLSYWPFTFGPLMAAASPSAPGNSSSGTQGGQGQGGHKGTATGTAKGTARARTGPANATEGPGEPGMARGQPTMGLGRSGAKPPSALRTLNGPGVHGPDVNGPGVHGPGVRGPGVIGAGVNGSGANPPGVGQALNGPVGKGSSRGPQGELAAHGTGPSRAANSGNLGVRALPDGGTNPWGGGSLASGGLPRGPGEINGSTLGRRGLAVAKIAPSPKATSINGTGLGRGN